MLRNQKGMTLIEIMIVIGILGALMAVMVPNVMDSFTKSKVKQSEIQMHNLKNALRNYMMDCGHYPSTDAGLEALILDPGDICKNWGPKAYIEKVHLRDRFGHPFEYENTGEKVIITFLGKDGRPGGKEWNKDISVEEEE